MQTIMSVWRNRVSASPGVLRKTLSSEVSGAHPPRSHAMLVITRQIATAHNGQRVGPGQMRQPSSAPKAPLNKKSPTPSMSLNRILFDTSESLGTPVTASSKHTATSGRLTANAERQPNALTRNPPRGYPRATQICDTIDSVPSTAPGTGSPCFVARKRMSDKPAG